MAHPQDEQKSLKGLQDTITITTGLVDRMLGTPSASIPLAFLHFLDMFAFVVSLAWMGLPEVFQLWHITSLQAKHECASSRQPSLDTEVKQCPQSAHFICWYLKVFVGCFCLFPNSTEAP